MTNWRARARLLAFACVAGLVLTGCGDDDDGSGGPNDGANGDSADQAGDGEELSPLEEYMGENSGFAGGGRMTVALGSADVDEEERQRMRQVEELVAACMEEAGFEYVPVDPFGGETGEDPFAEAYALPPDEFAREYGYGMTTLMNPDQSEDEAPADPNQEIRDGLSEAALEAYTRALWGDMADVEISDGSNGVVLEPEPGRGEPPSPEQMGCHGQASAEVYGEDGGMMQGPDMSEFEGLFEDLDALRQRIESDPRVVEATGAWSACMAEAGHSDFDTTTAPEDSVMERMSELYGWDDEPADDEGDGGPEVSLGGPDEVDVDEEALAELQAYEIAVATADYDCEEQEFADVQQEVAWGFEEDFVEEHRAELERYRDAMAEGPVGNAGGVG